MATYSVRWNDGSLERNLLSRQLKVFIDAGKRVRVVQDYRQLTR